MIVKSEQTHLKRLVHREVFLDNNKRIIINKAENRVIRHVRQKK